MADASKVRDCPIVVKIQFLGDVPPHIVSLSIDGVSMGESAYGDIENRTADDGRRLLSLNITHRYDAVTPVTDEG